VASESLMELLLFGAIFVLAILIGTFCVRTFLGFYVVFGVGMAAMYGVIAIDTARGPLAGESCEYDSTPTLRALRDPHAHPADHGRRLALAHRALPRRVRCFLARPDFGLEFAA
jgi:hypothetical protein